MSIDRVATSAQTAYFLQQITNAGNALDKTQEQIASTKKATTYAGFGDQTQVLTATLSVNARNDAYTTATKFGISTCKSFRKQRRDPGHCEDGGNYTHQV